MPLRPLGLSRIDLDARARLPAGLPRTPAGIVCWMYCPACAQLRAILAAGRRLRPTQAPNPAEVGAVLLLRARPGSGSCPLKVLGLAPMPVIDLLTREQRRALQMLANVPRGIAETLMIAYGFPRETVNVLVLAGF